MLAGDVVGGDSRACVALGNSGIFLVKTGLADDFRSENAVGDVRNEYLSYGFDDYLSKPLVGNGKDKSPEAVLRDSICR